MSQYANFYIKPLTGPYIPIGDYSSSSELYQIVNNDLPYGDITPVTFETLDMWIAKGEQKTQSLDNSIRKYQMKKEEIFKYNNSVEEKYEIGEDIDNTIEEITDSLSEVQDAVAVFHFFYRMIDAIRFEDGYNDLDNYLFAGVETNPNAKGEEE